MCRNFQIDFAVLTGSGNDFLVSSVLGEKDNHLRNFPFTIETILDIPESIGMDRIEEVMGKGLAGGLNKHMLEVLHQIYCSNPELRKIFDENEGNATYKPIKVTPITIH